jgi:MoaA/NifB/PqqE/SkfB family radical SAM enzyme
MYIKLNILKNILKKVIRSSERNELLSASYKRALTPAKEKNEALNNKEYKSKSLKVKSNPPTYILGLTNICNLRCPLCITGLRKQQKEKKFMEFNDVEDAIEKIKDYAVWVQLYKWGESLLHKDFIRILYKVKENNIAVQLSTNLNVKYDADLFYSFVEAPLDQIIVSFDGLTQETYSRYRVGGDVKKVIENVRTINKIKRERKSGYPVIDLQFLVNKYNMNEVSKLKRNFKDFGADFAFTTETILPFKCNDIDLARQWLPEGEIFKRKYFDVDLWVLNKVCPFLYKFMIIEQDGSIPPCCYTTDPIDYFAHFDNSKIINEIYNTEKFINARRLFNNAESVLSSGETNGLACIQCSVYKSYIERRSH